MLPIPAPSRGVPIGLAMLLCVSLSACSSVFEGYMADGCGGLRQMAGAYAADDREAFDEGTRESGAFDPAGDDIPGGKDAHQDLRAAWGARDALLLAAYVPPESVNGKEI